MIPSYLFYVVALVWFFGWGFLLLKYPVQSYRVLSWGRTPKPKQLKVARFVGYMGVGFGCLLLVELTFGIVR